MNYRTLIVPALGLSLTTSAFAAKQFLLDGSFETVGEDGMTPTGWQAFSGVRSGAFAFDGQFSCLASVRTNAFVGLYRDTVDAFAGTRVKLRCMAYNPSSAPITGNVKAGIKLEFRPPGGGAGPAPEENLGMTVGSPTDQWVLITLNTVVPPDVDSARIIMIGFESMFSTNGPVYIDNAFAALGSAPTTNLLLNNSFESGTSSANGLTNWTEFADPFSGARRNSFEVPSQDGLAVLKISGQNTAGVFQTISVTAGQTLTISAYARQRSTSPYGVVPADMTLPTPQAGVKVEWSSGTTPRPDIDIAPNDNPISGTTNIIQAGSPVDTWVPLTIDYTLPPQTGANLRCTVINGFGTADCDVYFDAFEAILKNQFNGADANNDGAEDMIDIARLQRVFAGNGGGLRFGGLVFDNDDDNDVDALDAAYVEDRMTGPANP